MGYRSGPDTKAILDKAMRAVLIGTAPYIIWATIYDPWYKYGKGKYLKYQSTKNEKKH